MRYRTSAEAFSRGFHMSGLRVYQPLAEHKAPNNSDRRNKKREALANITQFSTSLHLTH